ncbi:MAG TPA: N-acetylmuramoyl-L-alanine amidase [Gemmatimonadota bacterium]|nr:N-acetylmuramoyl-L-alanine amidase [Gemmatimonadota bacterium]
MTVRSFALAVLLVASAVPCAAQSVEVAVDGVVREVPVIEVQGERYVALSTVARLLGGRVEAESSEAAALVVDDRRLVVRRRIPYVEVDGRWYQLVRPAQKDATGFFIPATALDNLLPLLWPGRFPAPVSTSEGPRPLPYRGGPAPGGGTLSERPAPGDLDRIDLRVESDRTRLGFRMSAVPDLEVDDGTPGRLRIRIAGQTIPAAVADGLRGIGLVDSVAVERERDGSALTLWLDPRAAVYAVAPLREPRGFEVVVRSGGAEEAAIRLAADVRVDPPAPEPIQSIAAHGEMVAAADRPETAREPAPVAAPSVATPTVPAADIRPAAAPVRTTRGAWRIVIDAGHGGRDPGSIGPEGTREKDVTLRVARALAERLGREDGVEVVLTRDDDSFLALGERTRIANREQADLFVSIHANSAESRSAEGFETYFLSAAKSEDARRVAKMENSAIRYERPEIDPESLDELNFILWDLAQNEYLRESSALAETIQVELDGRLPLESRGVKQAGFFVLNGAYMPAVLFEMAFISNPREEALLNDSAFRTRLVDGLATSLLGYLDGYGRRLVAR